MCNELVVFWLTNRQHGLKVIEQDTWPSFPHDVQGVKVAKIEKNICKKMSVNCFWTIDYLVNFLCVAVYAGIISRGKKLTLS
jgi:hypothetical protein